MNFPRVLTTFGWLDIPDLASTILGNLAVFGPAVAAFILTGIEAGKPGMKSLWRRGWRVNFEKKVAVTCDLVGSCCGIDYLAFPIFD